ncbi:MAG: hypothetical protein H0W69_00365 [Gemmatimonadaceae bacterium]|nr:hypothetical protein [Gemmatimonadaceae bacterium]
MLSSPQVVNVMAQSGLDFLIIDLEHGPTTFETVEAQLYGVEAEGCTPIVRLGEASDTTILHVLEIGAQAILVSHVSTAAEAERIVRAAKYPPTGERGLSPFTRNHGFSDADLKSKLQRANDEMFVGVLVEGPEGIANLDAIASVPGLDLVYIGVYDVSQSVGAPGDLMHPEVVRVVKDCVRIIEGHGLAAGSVGRDRDYLQLLANAGFRFLSYRADSAILRDGLAAARVWYDELNVS